jgi:uroporphyrin-3 C-methyltransferase
MMKDKKQPLDNDQPSSSEQRLDSNTTISSAKQDKKEQESLKPSPTISDTPSYKKKATITKNDSGSPEATKISKVGLTALLIAMVGIVGSGVSYYWLEQQRTIVVDDFMATNQKNNTANLQRMSKLLKEQQDEFSQQLKQMVTEEQANSSKKITQLEDAVNRLERSKPSDWLIHEAEYLIRIAARTIWLERDTRAAIGLLKDADNRLAELNDPEFLPTRKLIHQDIEQLQLMPVLNTENVILALMGLNRQLASLPLLMQQVTTAENEETVSELSDDINDWQENLAKTWRNFLDTFVVIHVRDGSAKPLLSPQYQQNLRENLSLKVQQAQWAVKEEKSALYLATLAEIEMWLTQYFDMTEVSNQSFLKSINRLKTEMINFDYPSALSSLSAIRNILADKPLTIKTAEKTPEPPLTNNAQVLIDENVQKEAIAKPLIIEEQIHQQTTIQEKADDKENKNEDEI